MKPDSKALLLLSGGLDSAVLLYWVIAQGRNPIAIEFNFPGRLGAEARASRSVAGKAGVSQFMPIELPFIEPPREEHSAYIPKRNLMFYGIAASVAEQAGADEIFGGHIRPDGGVFPDAGRGYFDSLNALIESAARPNGGRPARIVTPFMEMEKSEVVRIGGELHVPFEMTWSCLRDGDRACSACSSCRKRAEAFRSAGVTDPMGAIQPNV